MIATVYYTCVNYIMISLQYVYDTRYFYYNNVIGDLFIGRTIFLPKTSLRLQFQVNNSVLLLFTMIMMPMLFQCLPHDKNSLPSAGSFIMPM